MPLFETHIVVDWSARSKPSPVRPTKDAIFWAVVRDGQTVAEAYCRTRAQARARLAHLLQEERTLGRRVLMGFDFPFGYPKGVAQRLTGHASALALWAWLASRIEDGPDNQNNRYDVAEAVNRHYDGCGPMWGRPVTWDHPDLPATARERFGDHPPERRLADICAKGAKTVWQLAYAGSVGSQVLMGLPLLQHLRQTTGAQVWPFDTGLAVPNAPCVLAEVYPSLLQKEAHAAQRADEPLDAAQVRVMAKALAQLDQEDALAPVFVPDVPPNAQHRIETEEAWILGLGFEGHLCRASQTAQAKRADCLV